MQLQLNKEIPAKAAAWLAEKNFSVEIGAWYISGIRIVIITEVVFDDQYYKDDPVVILYSEAEDWECTEWKQSKDRAAAFLPKWTKLDKDFSEYRDEAAKVLSGQLSVEVYDDKTSDSINAENALIGRTSKEMLISIQNELDKKKYHAVMVQKFMHYEIEKRKQ